MPQLFADCAVPLAVDTLFTYRVPDELRRAVRRGVRVHLPFGRRTVVGIVVRLTEEPPVLDTREITDVFDSEPILPDELLRLAERLADYYYSTPGEVLKAMLVQGALRPPDQVVSLPPKTVPAGMAADSLPGQIIGILKEKGPQNIRQLQRRTGRKHLHSAIAALQSRGQIVVEETVRTRAIRTRTEEWVGTDDRYRERWKDWLSVQRHSSSRFSRQRAIVRQLAGTSGTDGIPVKQLLRETRAPLSALRSLGRNGIIELARKPAPRQAGIDLHESLIGDQTFKSNPDQEAVIAPIASAIADGKFHPFLLHGVTGSGKTHVYIEAIRSAINTGKTAIVLVPEISLTPQIVRRFTWHFGAKVAVLHSRMSPGERLDTWTRVRKGEYPIVIGPRSAVFAPLASIGLIVVDEEHEPSYKQFDQNPRYHGRDVAVLRAQLAGATVVLGSATPSLESYANAAAGKYTLLELPLRVGSARTPDVSIVDMTEERRRVLDEFFAAKKKMLIDAEPEQTGKIPVPEPGSISALLREKIGDRLSRKEAIILLQNRRGFSPFIECPACGFVEQCEDCNITMTYHLTHRHLRCHYCGKVRTPPETCPKCGSVDIAYRGFGTQRVEQEVRKLFPECRLVRMDLDTTAGRGTHDTILKQFSEGKADILLGTQMVAKGLDFGRVTLVGVISADTQMLLPDFRSAERTFQLLMQVAGRAGRSTLAGEVIIQTRQPGHYCLRHVVSHDFHSFYEEELAARRELRYPPFSRIILVEFRGPDETDVMHHAEEFGKIAAKRNRHSIRLGPAPAAIPKIKGQYRWHIVLKCVKESDPSGRLSHTELREAMEDYRRSPLGKSRKVRIVVDMDPIGLM